MKYHNIEQNTDEWHSLRAGKITSSNLPKIMANYGKAFGEPAKKYASQIAVEQITGKPIASLYTNQYMEMGHELEPIARFKYEEKFFVKIENGGFFESEDVGCSPDGIIQPDGRVEIKSVIPSTHYNNIARQSFDPAYKWQLVGNMKFSNAEWIDYISYCQDFPSEKQLYVFRLESENYKKEFEMIDERVQEFRELIKKAKDKIMSCNYEII